MDDEKDVEGGVSQPEGQSPESQQSQGESMPPLDVSGEDVGGGDVVITQNEDGSYSVESTNPQAPDRDVEFEEDFPFLDSATPDEINAQFQQAMDNIANMPSDEDMANAASPIPPLDFTGGDREEGEGTVLKPNETRRDAADRLGPMSYYKKKNIEKGRGDKIPDLEFKDGEYVQKSPATLDSGKERDEDGLKEQREVPIESLQSQGPLAVDLQPDIIADSGVDGASSFVPQGVNNTAQQSSVEAATDSVDTVTASMIEVVSRMAANLNRVNDILQAIMDKLEVEDCSDEF